MEMAPPPQQTRSCGRGGASSTGDWCPPGDACNQGSGPGVPVINEAPQNPCTYAGRNLDPSAWAAMGKDTKLNPFTTTYDLYKGFAISGYLDAQPMATGTVYEKAAYGNYVFGAYMSAAGFPLGVTLAGANAKAYLNSRSNPSQYSNRVMDPKYRSLPAANVANITNGYNAQKNGTTCSKPPLLPPLPPSPPPS
jgi:hypothetical protein